MAFAAFSTRNRSWVVGREFSVTWRDSTFLLMTQASNQDAIAFLEVADKVINMQTVVTNVITTFLFGVFPQLSVCQSNPLLCVYLYRCRKRSRVNPGVSFSIPPMVGLHHVRNFLLPHRCIVKKGCPSVRRKSYLERCHSSTRLPCSTG